MEFKAIQYGESYFTENWATRDGDTEKRCNIVFLVYLLRLKNKMILIDAGCETMPGFEMKNFCGTVEALAKEGIAPEEITDVIITHAHHDHIECVKYFKNATIHIQKDEYINGQHFIPDGFKVNKFVENYILYDSIKIIKIGGHTKGSSVVEFSTGDKKHVMIADECYLKDYFEINAKIAMIENIDLYEKFYKKYGNGEYNILYSHNN